MSDADVSVLARKLVGRRAAPAGAPDIDRLLPAAGKAAQDAFSELLNAKIAASGEARGIATLTQSLAGRAPGPLYWLCDRTGAGAVLLEIAPGAAAMMTERLLGGAIVFPEADAKATQLDADMAGAFADLYAPLLLAMLQKMGVGAGKDALPRRRYARDTATALKDCEDIEALKISISVSAEGGALDDAILVYATIPFLSACGLIKAADAPGEPSATATGWDIKLKRALMATELALPVVITRLSTTVGDLSRLSVGQIIDLDAGALAALDVTAPTAQGHVTIAKGRLGSYQSRKAVKLTTPIDKDFLIGL